MVFVFRMISDEKDDFLRDFEIRSDQSFYDLHLAIQENLHYDQSQIASFFICSDKWEKFQEIALFGLSDEETRHLLFMDREAIGDHVDGLKQKLLYVFDFFNDRVFYLEVLDKKHASRKVRYPFCSKSSGCPPQQILMDRVYLDRDTYTDTDPYNGQTDTDQSDFNGFDSHGIDYPYSDDSLLNNEE